MAAMTTLIHNATRPIVLAAGEGEKIWFTNAAMTIKATADTTDGHLCLIESHAPVGHGPPLHVHHDEHEAFFILEGEMEIVCGEERYTAAAGAFAFLPRGVAHTFRVTAGSPARFLTVAVPGGLEGFFREVGRPAAGPGLPPQSPFDVALIKRVGESYNNEIVGPPLEAGH
jgi:mannose-6-phosphate isomerase-like protein (cupin superfamily)